MIEGICKAGPYQSGDKNVVDLSSVWNAVNLEGQWHIVHPFWICRCVVGRKAGGWIKLEADGDFIGKRIEASKGLIRNAFIEYYFLTDPKEFIYYCFPYEQKWQLLDECISQEEFINQPYVFSTFFGLDLKILSEESCLLESKNGGVDIKLKSLAKNANAINLWYELLIREETDNLREEQNMYLLRADNIPKLVSNLRCGDTWEFKVQLPVRGTYKLSLFGSPHNRPLLRLAEFRIDCSEKIKNCSLLPINPGINGFGPGPAAEEAGLQFPSRRNGFYQTTKKEHFVARFKLHEKLKPECVKSSLHRNVTNENGIVENVELREAVKMIMKTERKMEIKAKISEEGEHVLSISTALEEHTPFIPVCNYLLHAKNETELPTEVISFCHFNY